MYFMLSKLTIATMAPNENGFTQLGVFKLKSS